jgi:formyl-CoA transferase
MQNAFPKFSRTPGGVRSIAPQAVGEHNEEVYAERLGLGPDALAGLRRRGVI